MSSEKREIGGMAADRAAPLVILTLLLLTVPLEAAAVHPTAWVPRTTSPPPTVPVAPDDPGIDEDHPADGTPWPTVRRTPLPSTPTPEPLPPPPSPEPTPTWVTLVFTYVTERIPPTMTTTAVMSASTPRPPVVTETVRRAGGMPFVSLIAAACAVFYCQRRRR
jgi:hypothetical protein